ncbi:MAG: putative iron-sulfur cluster-binding metallochaperone [Candidatus Acidiferrales bacterium]
MADCCVVPAKPAVAPAVLACPVSGTRSRQVDALTVKSLVRHLAFGEPPTQYYFCEAPDCEVVYFPWRDGATRFLRDDLLVRVWPKDRRDDTSVCYCFGVTRKQLREELERSDAPNAAARIKAEVQAGHCACEVKNPSGKCCLGNIARVTQELQAVTLSQGKVRERA